MKRLLIGILLVGIIALILPISAFAQIAPVGDKVLLAGPIYGEEGASFRWGLGKRVGESKVWIAAFGQFGNSVEAFAETTILFQLSQMIHLGPVAGVGTDWSNEPGTKTVSPENYMIYAAGIAVTLSFPKFYVFKEDQIGLWGYFKYQAAPNDDNLYKSGVTGGVGLYYRA